MSTEATGLSLVNDTEDKAIVFDGTTSLYRIFDEMCGEDFVIVNNVSRTDFDRIDKEREIRRRKFRFFFQADKRQLCVTLPSGPHEGMHATLFDAIRTSMTAHPPMPPWYPCAARVYSHPNGTSCKEADSGGFPGHSDTSGGDARWPALVIECGMNQSLVSLHAAMRWWFSASGHRVKIVLVVKLHRSTHTIAIEKFTEEHVDGVGRPGATTTRSVSARSALVRLQPVLQQTITVAPVPDSNPTRYHATRGALVIEFELLYRRAPGPSPSERDVVVSEEKLEEVAGEVWH
ncbi:dead deah box dna helicase [Ophiostoma piceae UAMH 11346]|uniref:Dead deah box dna helicase n=1 Tax=Ophiostoma piceae (strain UAMH 11346) TaxID=1262450 RepID=S3D6U3_OPHP1|nr:dead deah box dna helicase [Ophiostoma piceae UAMH 11346]